MKIGVRLGAACVLCMAGAVDAADGDFDTTFSGDGKARVTWPYQISNPRVAIAADGSILHATTEVRASGAESNLDFAIAKLDPDGTLDSSFGFLGQRTVGFDLVTNGDDTLLGVFPLANGGVLLAGRGATDVAPFSYQAPGFIRLTPDGDRDLSFGEDGQVVFLDAPWSDHEDLRWNAVVRQPDGKFVFVGACFSCDGAQPFAAIRIDENGQLDATFGDDGWFIYEHEDYVEISEVSVDAWGRIVLAGAFEPDDEPQDRPWLMRLTPSGQPDPTFGAGGTGYSFLSSIPLIGFGDWHTSGIAIDSDGSIVLSLENNGAGLVRTLPDGGLDTDFGVLGFLDLEREDGGEMNGVTIQSDHRIVAVGSIDHTNGDYDHYIVRTLPDGALDASFAGNGLLRVNMTADFDDSASNVVLDAGRPLIVGRGGEDIEIGTVIRLESDLIFASGCGD